MLLGSCENTGSVYIVSNFKTMQDIFVYMSRRIRETFKVITGV